MRRAAASSAELGAALADRLELEHEALWLLGTIGGRIRNLRDRAGDAYRTHRGSRDRLLTALDRLGVDAPTAQASYGIPPADEAEALEAMVDVEGRLVAACLQVVRASTPRRREAAVSDLRDAATAVLAWGGDPQAFPGLD